MVRPPLVAVLALIAACTRSPRTAKPPSNAAAVVTVDLPPVAVNPVSPIEYPADLLAQQVEGRVLLRLYIDSMGKPSPDSSRIAESSGYAALDSAALAGVRDLRFAPALHRGRPAAISFIQPVLFRVPRTQGAAPPVR